MSFYDISFGLCMSLRNEKSKKVKQADKRYVSRIWREVTAHTNANKMGLFGGLDDVINPTNICLDRYSLFGATGGQSWGLP
jgi:hypothetical protein